MRPSLYSSTYISLLVLWGYAFSNPGFLLLKQTQHTAFSKPSIYVEFYITDNSSTSTNATVNLLDIRNTQVVTSKEIPANKTQGILEFECFYFTSAGLYQFEMSLERSNDSTVHVSSGYLNVSWPVFHIDLNRTSKEMQRSFQVGVFTNEQLCSEYSGQQPKVFLEVEHTQSFQGLAEPSTDQFMLYKTYKDVPLSTAQWVEFECASVRPETFITVSLKPIDSESVIAYIGPIDLVKTFKYKLITMTEKKCDSSIVIYVIAPPCNYVEGKMIVYKESPRSPGESVTTLAENALQKGDRNTQFNCTLFEIGKNKYCFEFLVSSSSNPNVSLPRAKQCVEIRREIETWSLWQPWSSCSTTCGDGHRERYRTCLSSPSVKPSCSGTAKETSLCSLEDCSTVKPSSKSTPNDKDVPNTNNTVTITGISLCLFIIFVTVVITVWRKFGKGCKCRTTTRHSSVHSVNCWKNSDEENIYQMRESFSDAGDGQPECLEDGVHIPLNYRQNTCDIDEVPTGENDCSQANSQKIIPPIFSYRLAQQQLKEMKQKGLTEATKLYHVSQSPMTDTAVDISLAPPLVPEDNLEEMGTNKFRIQSPFLDPKNCRTKCAGEKNYSKFPQTPGYSQNQTLPKASHLKNTDTKAKYDRSYQKNNFRRTSSFHETKHIKPYRERSLTSLSPRHAMIYNSRTRMWEYSTVDRSNNKPTGLEKSPKNLTRGISLPPEATGPLPKNQYPRPGEKPDLICGRHTTGRQSKMERPDQNRLRKGPSPVEKTWNRTKNVSPSSKDIYHRKSPQSPAHYRHEKCQSFPWATDYSFYDNSTFGLTEAEQQMLDLPGYFASNEEDETSTLSIERLVI
ncbi:thrombospondin type-1 domain-containing protein 1 isoform X2 [Pyxicephalus adspersus]|uniref:thrombospondin type-1 domain-containing protein 1 isoform X2 n=1 Tax=Pyxicephalus adspersus TaxID=30357 RepID=UPI003B5CEF57